MNIEVWPCCGGQSEHRYPYHVPDPEKVKDAKALGIYFKGTITDILKKPNLEKLKRQFPDAREYSLQRLTDPYICLEPKEEQKQLALKTVDSASQKSIQVKQVITLSKTSNGQTVASQKSQYATTAEEEHEPYSNKGWFEECIRRL